jgi:hypothetical protein
MKLLKNPNNSIEIGLLIVLESLRMKSQVIPVVSKPPEGHSWGGGGNRNTE